ncbi:MAG: hypothetical protein JXB45_05720 [Candidatus Krumholzibacteriota bacterium]|nr:hypothetical protein [Candidatus Krumholzibacteriota bacterium]
MHMGEVPYPEVVAEMADMLLQLRRISWSFCTGRFRHHLILSMRSSNPTAQAGHVISKLAKDKKAVGGHNLFAGGKIPFEGEKEGEIIELENRLLRDFARFMGYENPEWKMLLDPSQPGTG